MPCHFTGPKMFWAGPNFLCQTKIYLRIVAVTNILCQTKRWFALNRIGFRAGEKVFEEAPNGVKFLGWLKKFGLPQNILGPVKGQGIHAIFSIVLKLKYTQYPYISKTESFWRVSMYLQNSFWIFRIFSLVYNINTYLHFCDPI